MIFYYQKLHFSIISAANLVHFFDICKYSCVFCRKKPPNSHRAWVLIVCFSGDDSCTPRQEHMFCRIKTVVAVLAMRNASRAIVPQTPHVRYMSSSANLRPDSPRPLDVSFFNNMTKSCSFIILKNQPFILKCSPFANREHEIRRKSPFFCDFSQCRLKLCSRKSATYTKTRRFCDA